MENDLNISLEGFNSERDANILGKNLMDIINAIGEHSDLDISRLRKIVVTMDFPSALQRITAEYKHVNPSSFTNSSQAVAIAKLLSKMTNDKVDEYTLVLSTDFFYEWFRKNMELGSLTEEAIRPVFHRIHHELVHVHERNTLTLLNQKKVFGEYDYALLLSGISAWSEYFANFISSVSATDEQVRDMLGTLENVLLEVPEEISGYVMQYSTGAISLEKMYQEVSKRVKLIVNVYAYAHGYIHSIDIDVEEHFNSLHVLLQSSELSISLLSLGGSLVVLRDSYNSGNIKSYDAFENIVAAIELVYKNFGIVLERTGDDGMGLYISFN